jgi:trimeric autotransporter adhesin
MISNLISKPVLRLGVLALLLLLTSCGGSSSDSSATVAKVIVSPSISSLPVRGQQKFTATAVNSSGNAITTATFTWSSSNADVASIDSNGIAVAKGSGTALITATAESNSVASAPVTLTVMPPIASVSITPISASIKMGEKQHFTATAFDLSGNSVSNAVFQWGVSYSGIASIDPTGNATGISAGTVMVTATTGGVTSPIATLSVTN